MFWFKQCPRCSGDLFEDKDQYGKFITCMQCGFAKDAPNGHRGVMVITAEPVPAPVTPPADTNRKRRISHGGRHFTKTLSFDTGAVTETAA